MGAWALLSLIEQVREAEAQPLGLSLHLLRPILRIRLDIIGRDRDNPSLPLIVHANPRQLLLDILHIGAVHADEHHQQTTPVHGNIIPPHCFSAHHIRQLERRSHASQLHHRRLRLSHRSSATSFDHSLISALLLLPDVQGPALAPGSRGEPAEPACSSPNPPPSPILHKYAP